MKEKFFRPEIMDKSLTRSRKTPLESGCRRGTSVRADIKKVYRSLVHLQVTPLVERCRVGLVFKGVFRVAR